MSNPSEVLATLRNSFNSGITKNVAFRTSQLKALLRMMEENSQEMVDAISKDLHRPKSETLLSDVEIVKNEALNAIYNLSSWMAPEKPEKTLVNMMDQVLLCSEPYGVVLIIGPWNYPIQLAFSPLVGAIAAGNCAVVKPSELAPASSKLVAKLVPKYLDNDCYKVIEGGIAETTALLELRFDYIFYTGSTHVGRIVNMAAAKHLTPVTLELGGKSPVYLDDSVDMDIAARRILWGKCVNSGQTCIAPDYILCPKNVEKKFIESSKKILEEFYADKLKQSPDYSRIITESHFKRVAKMLEGANVALGGTIDPSDRFIHPTILVDVKPTDPVMKEEIFGPLLPILTVDSPVQALNLINQGEKPLALYIFSNRKGDVDLIIQNTSSGGVCVNDTVMHFACEGLPFGGVGHSGMGGYHGKFSFDTFTHKKGVLMKSMSKLGEKIQMARYPPYNEKKLNFLLTMLKKRPSIPTRQLWYLVVFGMGMLATMAVRCASDYFDRQGNK